MANHRSASLLCLSILSAVALIGCAVVPGTPAPGPKASPTAEPRPSGINPAAKLGLSAATGIEVLAFVTQGPGGQPGYVPRLAISDAATVAQVVATLNTDTKALPGALCIPELELRFRLRDGAVKKLMYSCEGASFLRSDDPAWGVGDLQPPAAFDKIMQELLGKAGR